MSRFLFSHVEVYRRLTSRLDHDIFVELSHAFMPSSYLVAAWRHAFDTEGAVIAGYSRKRMRDYNHVGLHPAMYVTPMKTPMDRRSFPRYSRAVAIVRAVFGDSDELPEDFPEDLSQAVLEARHDNPPA